MLRDAGCRHHTTVSSNVVQTHRQMIMVSNHQIVVDRRLLDDGEDRLVDDPLHRERHMQLLAVHNLNRHIHSPLNNCLHRVGDRAVNNVLHRRGHLLVKQPLHRVWDSSANDLLHKVWYLYMLLVIGNGKLDNCLHKVLHGDRDILGPLRSLTCCARSGATGVVASWNLHSSMEDLKLCTSTLRSNAQQLPNHSFNLEE